MTSLQYKSKFMELACFTPQIVVDDSMKVYKFQHGLRPNIHFHTSMLRLKTFMDVVKTARIAEKESDEL